MHRAGSPPVLGPARPVPRGRDSAEGIDVTREYAPVSCDHILPVVVPLRPARLPPGRGRRRSAGTLLSGSLWCEVGALDGRGSTALSGLEHSDVSFRGPKPLRRNSTELRAS